MGTVIIIFMSFTAILGVAGAVANQQRRSELRTLAAGKRWDVLPRSRDLPKTFLGQPFHDGHSRRALNILSGEHNGRPTTVFDYKYETGSGDDEQTHHYWVACVDLPAPLPILEVVPRSGSGRWSHHGGGVAGAPDFPRGDAGFDARYRVRTQDPRLADAVLTAEVLRLLAGWPDLAWRIEGDRMLAWGRGALKPQWVESTLNMLTTLTGTVPAWVWQGAAGPTL